MDAEAIRNLMGPHVAVDLRRMFGGHGIYTEGRIFGIESDGEIFLKVDDESRAFFEGLGSGPFVYQKKIGEQAIMSYYRLPAEAYDDEAMLAACIQQALGAARRAGAPARPVRKSRPPRSG